MEVGDIISFEIIDANTEPEYDSSVIAFVPGESFQWCHYFNGSKTWQSNITKNTVQPTVWFKLITNANQ